MMEQDEQGWSYTDSFVCTACISDYALKEVIASAESPEEVCSFCDQSPAAPFDALMAAFVTGLRNEYNDVESEMLPWNGREGGYQFFAGPGVDSYDLVYEFGAIFTGDGIEEEVQEALSDTTWVKRDYAWCHPDEALRDAWAAFSDTVKYRTRYVMWLVDDTDEREFRDRGEVPPGRILHHVGALLDDLGLVSTLPAGSTMWRAQTHQGDELRPSASAGRLGTAPRELARQPNRMSPAGIPMFYGATGVDTAVAEVALHAPSAHDHVTSGRFVLSSAIAVVDFTGLPPVPSIFDPRLGHYRREISFLQEFVATLSAPVEPGDEAIDYVPTQILTEFLLRIFKPATATKPPVGLVYPSAARPGGVSAVIDIPNDRCVDDRRASTDHPCLILDSSTVLTNELTR